MEKGQATRERLLDITETSVLRKGFGATSTEEVITEAGITKSGFLYHFSNKNALARALLLRYMAREDSLLDDVFARSRELAEDPLQGFLVGLKLLADMVSTVIEGGLVLGRVTGERTILPNQLMLLRSYIKLLFEPGTSQ